MRIQCVGFIGKKGVNGERKNKAGILAVRIVSLGLWFFQLNISGRLSETDLAHIMRGKWIQICDAGVRGRIYYARAFATRPTRETTFFMISNWFILVYFRLLFIFQACKSILDTKLDAWPPRPWLFGDFEEVEYCKSPVIEYRVAYYSKVLFHIRNTRTTLVIILMLFGISCLYRRRWG